jgi:hypothetical protein
MVHTFQVAKGDTSTRDRIGLLAKHYSCVQALDKFGIKDDVENLLQVADKNGDGQIDYQEFVLLMRETNKELKESGGGGPSLLRGLNSG